MAPLVHLVEPFKAQFIVDAFRPAARPDPDRAVLHGLGPALPSAARRGHTLVSTAPASERPTAPQGSLAHSLSSFKVSPETIAPSASSDRETPNASFLKWHLRHAPRASPGCLRYPNEQRVVTHPPGPSAPSAPPLPPASPGGCVSSSSASRSPGSGRSFALGSPQLVFGSWPSWRVRQAPDSCHPVRLLTLLERPG